MLILSFHHNKQYQKAKKTDAKFNYGEIVYYFTEIKLNLGGYIFASQKRFRVELVISVNLYFINVL